MMGFIGSEVFIGKVEISLFTPIRKILSLHNGIVFF